MSLLTDFRNPPNDYRFAPFWFWNHELKLDELERQIMDMKDHGLGGFVMHARHGLQTPYMGRDWLAAVEHCAKVAAREKMWAWLYDEDNWPSGTVGLRMAREHPEFRMSQLWISDQADLKKGESLDRPIKVEDDLYCVLAIPCDDDDLAQFGKQRDITRRVKDGRLQYTASRSSEKVAVFSRIWYHGAFHDGYLDTLNPKGTAWFIEETHDKYAAHLKSLLGKSIKGIFTDEPSAWYSWKHFSIPFTEELPRRFERESKISFLDALVALFFKVGPETARVRLAFHRTGCAMYMDGFFKPIHQWCEDHKVRSIGHVDNEGEFSDQVKEQFDYFASAAQMHYAGVDTLFESTFKQPQLSSNHMACKMASSAEHLLERERTMAESFGVAAGWELTLPTLKWLGDFQAAMGINYFMPHAAYYSIAGFRKWECPPDESGHVSYWPFYRVFADHLARLCLVLHGGEHIAPVLLLSPVASMAAALNPAPQRWFLEQQVENTEAKAIHETLIQVVDQLSRHQLDFDFITEELLQRGRLNGTLELEILGQKDRVLERFRALVLPHVTALSRRTVDLLEEWAGQGLPIIFVETQPDLSPEEGQDPALEDRVRKLLELPNVCLSKAAAAAFVGEIKGRIKTDLDVGEVRDIVYLMKDKDEARYVLLVNASRTRGYERLKVRLRADGPAHLLNTITGEARLLTPLVQEVGWTTLELDFVPAGSHLLMFTKRPAVKESVPPKMATVEGSRLTLGSVWQFTPEGGNFFPLRRWQLEIHGESRPHDKWSYCRKTFRTEFHAAISPNEAWLLADGLFDQRNPLNTAKPGCHLLLNGHELTEWREGTHYDRLVPEADVTSFIRQGMNELVVTGDNQFTPGLNLDQVLYLAGEFTVAGQGEHEVLSIARSSVHTGNWAAQGFPYFSGIGRYEQEFELPAELAGQRLFLEFEKVAHLVQVFVNETEAGLLPWAPYSLEVTRLMAPGRNRLSLRIANSMSNLFLLRPDESGLTGKVTLVAKRPIE